MDDIDLFTIWVGLSIISEYPADDVRESSSSSTELVISFFHQSELQALNEFSCDNWTNRKFIIYIAKKDGGWMGESMDGWMDG